MCCSRNCFHRQTANWQCGTATSRLRLQYCSSVKLILRWMPVGPSRWTFKSVTSTLYPQCRRPTVANRNIRFRFVIVVVVWSCGAAVLLFSEGLCATTALWRFGSRVAFPLINNTLWLICWHTDDTPQDSQPRFPLPHVDDFNSYPESQEVGPYALCMTKAMFH